jgi:hypothetical protein
MNTNEQKGGYEAELKEAERAENQERTTAWGRRNRNEILTVDDYRLWKKRKRIRTATR